MNRSLKLILTSVVGVTALAAAAIAHQQAPSTPTPKAAIQEVPSTPTPKTAIQEATPGLKGGPGDAMKKIEDLDLTAEQQAEMAVIQASIAEQIAEILTPEQLESFQATQAEGGSMRSMMMSLDRSQRSAVMGIMQSAQSDMLAVLTPEQQAQIEAQTRGSSPLDRN